MVRSLENEEEGERIDYAVGLCPRETMVYSSLCQILSHGLAVFGMRYSWYLKTKRCNRSFNCYKSVDVVLNQLMLVIFSAGSNGSRRQR